LNKKFCHLLVGFSIYNYFKNLITSVLELDSVSDIYVITTGNPKFFGWGGKFDIQYNESKKIEKLIKDLKIKYKRENIFYYEISTSRTKDPKVGALYTAYNLGLEIAKKNNVDYLNIMQNDSQLMLWSKNLEKIIEKILDTQDDVFYLNSSFFRKAVLKDNFKTYLKRDIIIDSNNHQKNIFLNKDQALGDCGVFDINKLKKINFKFYNNENFLSKYLSSLGFKTVYSPIPFVSFLPWPVVVRQERIIGSILPLKKKNYLILEPVTEKDLFTNSINWEEDYVKSNGWWSLKPNWATDLNLECFKIFFNFYRNNQKKQIFFSKKNEKRFFYPPSIKEDYRPEIIQFFLTYPFNTLIKIINKFLLFLKK